MTCIIGLKDKDGRVWMAADRLGIRGQDTTMVGRFPKIVDKTPAPDQHLLIGFAGNTTMRSILDYRWDCPEDAGIDSIQYITASLAPSLVEMSRTCGLSHEKDGQILMPGNFLVAYQGFLVEICNDGSVVFIDGDYFAVGMGMYVALGALHALHQGAHGLSEIGVLIAALRASEKFEAGVGAPFDSFNDRGEDWTVE